MNFKETLSKLEKSSEFREFKKKNSDAYLCAGFFILDFDANQNIQQVDFQCKDKIAAFSVNGKITVKMEETADKKIIPPLKKETKIDLDDVQEIVKKETKKNQISSNMKKIIAILQNYDGKQIWNITCIFASFLMLRLHIDSVNGKILKTEKANLFDFIKKP